MAEFNFTSATPEHVEAVRSMAGRLLDLVGGKAEPVALDSLISAYISLMVLRSTEAMTQDLQSLALVRHALLTAVQAQSGPAQPLELVKQLANLILLPDVARHPHAVALSALLSTYRELLARHPCCAETHAAHLFTVWQEARAMAGAANAAKPVTH